MTAASDIIQTMRDREAGLSSPRQWVLDGCDAALAAIAVEAAETAPELPSMRPLMASGFISQNWGLSDAEALARADSLIEASNGLS